MENDAIETKSHYEIENKQQTSEQCSKTIIDTINNNINCLIERLQGESESVKSVIACDESSLPSPKAMLETIMPCEKLCNSFRHIADDLSAGSLENALKTQIKSEQNEPKLAFDDEHFEFPLNLKAAFRTQKGQFNVSTLFFVRVTDFNLFLITRVMR